MKTQIFSSYEDFVNREEKTVNGMSPEFAEQYYKILDDSNNAGCWNCTGCKGCKSCKGCTECTGCTSCTECISCTDCTKRTRWVGVVADPLYTTKEK